METTGTEIFSHEPISCIKTLYVKENRSNSHGNDMFQMNNTLRDDKPSRTPNREIMGSHDSAVFNHSCLKCPKERTNASSKTARGRRLNDLENGVRELNLASDEIIRGPDIPAINDTKSFISFYDSIPNYEDINYLSSRDFYRKVETLRERQRNYREFLKAQVEIDSSLCDECFGGPHGKNGSVEGNDFNDKHFSGDSRLGRESTVPSEKDTITPQPPSRRSVRIEEDVSEMLHSTTFRPKSRADRSLVRSKTPNDVSENWNSDVSHWESPTTPCDDRKSFSTPTTPMKTPKVGGITVPKPFKMTIRDEEKKIIDKLMPNCPKLDSCKSKHKYFEAHPVPLECQIPLFDKIMYEKEKRRQQIKRKSKAWLMSQMRPFSFTKRDEEIQAINKRLSKSTPCLTSHSTPLKTKPTSFKAKPIPKNLFSDQAYRKMQDDEFYRALQRKIRSEEMLKVSSLPPSMAKREEQQKLYSKLLNDYDCQKFLVNTQCPSYKDSESYGEFTNFDGNINNKNLQKPRKKKSNKRRKFSAESKATTHSTSTISSVNRSNLAAVLRIESARKRLQMEMLHKLEDLKQHQEARWKEKTLRRKPIWQYLEYSHEDDLAMRLQRRQENDRLRNEEHRHRMKLMMGRVDRQRTLFERQSEYNKFKCSSNSEHKK